MKLIIDIPEDMYQTFHNTQPRMGDAGMDNICQAIVNGTPLDNETVDVLNKIIAEIEEYKSRTVFGIGIKDLETGRQVALDNVLGIIDKYMTESEDKE